MNAPEQSREAAQARFRRTLIQVLIVQAVALTFLGMLQIFYG